MTEKQYITRDAYAILHIPGLDEKYFCLAPYPVMSDDWQHFNERRFTVVPHGEIGWSEDGGTRQYSYARHVVVAGNYVLEMIEPTPIKIWKVSVDEIIEETNVMENENGKIIEDLFSPKEQVPEWVG